jgi:hypothetical protein
MSPPALLIAAALAGAAGALVLWWAVACRRGGLRRQWLLGCRTPRTMRDPDAWVAAHRAAAPSLLVAGAGMVAAGVAAAVLVLLGLGAIAPVLLGSGMVWFLAALLIGCLPAAAAIRRVTSGKDVR